MSRGRCKSSSSRKFTSSRTHSAAVHPRKRSVLETSGLLHGWRFLDKEPKENLKKRAHQVGRGARRFIDTKLRSPKKRSKRVGMIYSKRSKNSTENEGLGW